MKRHILVAILLAAAVGLTAGGLDLQSRVMLQRRALEKDRADASCRAAKGFVAHPANETETVMAFARIAEGYGAADLADAGMSVLAVRGNIAIVTLDIDRAEEFGRCPAVRKLSLQRPVKPLLDKSRASAGVDAIHAGTGLDVPYTGKGVLAAIVDQGVDPNHVMFQKDGGKSRVEYLSYFDGYMDSQGVPRCEFYGDAIYDEDSSGNPIWYPTADEFVTDELSAFHGTHTMGILAGGYKGKVEVAKGLNGLRPAIEEVDNPYYGVATDAQLAVSCGALQDAAIAFGLNGILDYAWYAREAEGRPSVVSLSLGGSAGPHDKNGLMNTFLDECGKETIIVLAAGNEGDLKIALKKKLTAGDTSVATMIYPFGYRYNPAAGAAGAYLGNGVYNTYMRSDAVMIYSDDATPFQIKPFVMTQNADGSWRRRATFDCSSADGSYYLSDASYANYVGGTVNSTVARYFDGYIGGGTMLDEDLGRWYGVFDYYLLTSPENGFNADGSESVIVGFEVIGQEGHKIECYCYGMNTWMSNYGVAGYDDGQRDGTISDMAVTDNTLVVGAYTENRMWTSLDGRQTGYDEAQGFVVGDIAQYSSYGTFDDGTTLPHVCAPGSAVISAMSTPCVEDAFKGNESYIPSSFQARATVDGRTYYWMAETGTSMSTPFVAGSIALWLEADPTLTIADVKDIVKTTARRDTWVEGGNAAQWGAGKFDALAGLKEVITRRNSGIEGIVAESENNRLIVTPSGNNRFDVFVGDAQSLAVGVYSMTGACTFSAAYSGCEATVDLGALAPGIYAINVNGHSKKIAVK